MTAEAKFLAFDLGAESGRGVIGCFDGEKIRLEDVHRFSNGPVRLLDTLYWDALRLFSELKRTLGMAVAAHGKDFSGIGIDTWGVDFGLLGRGDTLLGNPRHYRDHGNDGMMEQVFAIIPRDELFHATGIQFLQFNTIFQLLALKRMHSPLLEAAETLLFTPDLFNFWFTGVKTTEYTIASTSQFIDPYQRIWAKELLHRLEIPSHFLTDIVTPGTQIGTLRSDIAEETGAGPVPLVVPAEHDTGSAVVAVPASTPDYAYVSCGTWSLMGIETQEPRISELTRAANVTNEGGACGTIRLLKNIMGLWLVQECRRSFARTGQDYSYAELTELAAHSLPFVSIIEPDYPAFLSPDDMPTEIRRYCARTGQSAPADTGAMVRCCLESVALKYRWTLEQMEAFRGKQIDTIHMVGGGTQNRLLCQLAADATRRTVIAGPVEATAMGNILMQAIGRGHLSSLEQAREVVRQSCDLITYTPQGDANQWEAAYGRFMELHTQDADKL